MEASILDSSSLVRDDTLLAILAITEDVCDWNDHEAIARLRIMDPACGKGRLLKVAAERIRDLSPGSHDDSSMAQALIEKILAGYDINLTATHMAACQRVEG